MSPKQTVVYLRGMVEKWELVIESLEEDDSFREVALGKITDAKTRMKQIVNKESPEDFLAY